MNASIMKGVISDGFRKIIKDLPEDFVRDGSEIRNYYHLTHSKESLYNISLIDMHVERACLHVDLIVKRECSEYDTNEHHSDS